MNRLIVALREALTSVLAQSSGQKWVVETAPEAVADQTQQLCILVRVSGGLPGDFTLDLSHDAGCRLAQALMMSPEVPQDFKEEEREALLELFRQVCGLASTTLRSDYGDTTFDVSLVIRAPFEAKQQSLLTLVGPEWSGSVQLALSDELLSALDSVASKHTAHDEPTARASRGTDLPPNLELLLQVQLGVRLRFGSRTMRLREILELHPGAVIELDRQVQDPVDLLVDNKLIARGEVVIVDGCFGLRVGEVLGAQQRLEAVS